MRVYVCVYARTPTHCRLLGREPRGRDETSGWTNESRWIQSWRMCIGICDKLHMCMYMLGGRMRSWTKYFFL